MAQVTNPFMDVMSETKHGFKALQFGGLFSFLLLSRMDKFTSWQRLLPVLICFIICRQREMCLSLRQVVSKIYWSESNFYFSQTIGQRFCCTLCVLHRDQYLKRKKRKRILIAYSLSGEKALPTCAVYVSIFNFRK